MIAPSYCRKESVSQPVPRSLDVAGQPLLINHSGPTYSVGVNPWQNPDWDITPEEAHRRHSLGEVELIDVREAYEWTAGHASGSSHVEIERIAARAWEVPTDRAVVFLCLGGIRSGMVAHAFRSVGYEAYNVAGGFRAWVAADLPTEPRDAVMAPH